MKEAIENISTRIRNPLSGSFIVAFLVANWQALFFLLIDNGITADRIQYFHEHTSFATLFWYPVTFAVAYTVLGPWVNLLVLRIGKKPTEHKNSLQADSEHKLLLEKLRLEKIRSKLQETREEELIGRAKRDVQVAEIDDDEVRKKLESELASLRQQGGADDDATYRLNGQLLHNAGVLRDRARTAKSTYDSDGLLEKAQQLEDQANALLLKESRVKSKKQERAEF